MAKYVLEVLDGDRVGDVVPVGDRAVRIGRRPGNDLILADEKTSGVHAEVVPEGDRHVLRDLGSTNGTFLDGKRVTELVLTPGDEVTIGRWRVKFRLAEEAGAPVDAGELAVRRLDAGRLQKRGGSVGVLAIVAVLVVGAGLWWWLRGTATATDDGGGRGPRAVLAVAGNKLPAELASCESEEGWDVRAGGAAFAVAGGAHTGQGALQCSRGDAPNEPDFALLRPRKPISVLPGRSVTVTAHGRCEQGAKVAVRAYLASNNEQVPFRFRTGGKIEGGDGWQQLRAAVAVPPGCDQLWIEVVALLPNVGSSVRVDDVAVLDGGEAALVEHKLAETGQIAQATGAALVLRSVDTDNPAILLGVLPGAVPPEFAGLHRADLCVLSDLGAQLQVTPAERGFHLAATEATTLRLVLPAEAAAGLLAGDDAGAFAAAQFGAEFQARSLLTGEALTRAWWQFAGLVACDCRVAGGRFAMTVAAGAVDVVLGFRGERVQAGEIVRQARARAGAGHPGEALDQLRDMVTRLPMDTETLAEAQVLRSELLATQAQRVQRLQQDLDEAEFFSTRGGFERVALGVDEVLALYGDGNLDNKGAVLAMRDTARDRLQKIDDGSRDQQRARLQQLAKVFVEAQQPALAQLIEQYVGRHLQGSGPEGNGK